MSKAMTVPYKKKIGITPILFKGYHQIIVVKANTVIKPTSNPEYKNIEGASCPLCFICIK